MQEIGRKKPWPLPPPPPPPPFLARRDWVEHAEKFMVPLGGELDAAEPRGAEQAD